LPRDPSVLRTIVREANQCLGLYASVIETGSVTTGDAAELVPGSASSALAKQTQGVPSSGQIT
jgi:MOSC domain-containing protein YiiM